ncbi:MAG: hypothetical protein WCN98_19065, partial [Verrucomicrobiaceae bacterium]
VGLIVLTIIADQMNWWTGISKSLASVTDKVLRTSENNQSAADANHADVSGSPKAKLVAKTKTTVADPQKEKQQAPQPVLNTEQKAALNVVSGFLRATSIKDRVQYVCQQEVWGPKMREYYALNGGDGPVPFERVELVEGGQKIPDTYTFSVLLLDGQHRNIVAGKSDSGNYLVDWPSFALYSEMQWDQFRSQRPTAPVAFRALATPGNYFKNDFNDAEKLVCLKLTNPLKPAAEPIYAYAERNTTIGKSMELLMKSFNSNAIPLIVRLKYPPTPGADNQVLIGEFVGEGWVASAW